MRRAAIYARFSSHNQRDESIEIQVENCQLYAADNGYTVAGVYTDYAQTGTNSDRAGLQSMVADAKRGLFDAVIIYKVTRIMRNRDEMGLLRITLKKCGVEILYAGEDIPQGSGGVLQLGLLEVLAEYESALTAERIRAGIQKNAERCMANGHTLYGWDIVNGYYEVNENERFVLTRIKDGFLSGMTLQAAIDSVGPQKTKRGAPLRVASVAKMLKRPQNMGTYTYAGHVVPGGMPALWSEDEHRKLLERFERRSNPMKTENTSYYPLSQKMRDKGCSRAYVGESGRSETGRTYHYYHCKDCGRRIPKDALEKIVADAVIEELSSPDRREQIARMVADYQIEDEDTTSMTELLQSQIDEIDKTFDRIWKAIEDGIAPPGGKERVEELKERRASLQDQLETARALESVTLDHDHVLFWLETMAADLDPEKICSTFVQDVTVDGDALHVRFLFDDLNSSSGLPMVEERRHQTNSHVYPIKRGFVIVIDLSTPAPRK